MENLNQNTTGTATGQQQERTFTQEQVNAIVGKRLAEARASFEAELSKRETELNKREMQIRAKELLEEKGLPKDLSKVLRYDDEESLTAAIDVLEMTRGFKAGSQNTEQAEVTGKRKILENRLPEGTHETLSKDPIRKAMGLK